MRGVGWDSVRGWGTLGRAVGGKAERCGVVEGKKRVEGAGWRGGGRRIPRWNHRQKNEITSMEAPYITNAYSGTSATLLVCLPGKCESRRRRTSKTQDKSCGERIVYGWAAREIVHRRTRPCPPPTAESFLENIYRGWPGTGRYVHLVKNWRTVDKALGSANPTTPHISRSLTF